MTRLRKLAVKISDTVVRRSLPAYKDWARATSRELEFIESDWAALRWALGSWKMAASCQMNASLTSMSDVPRAAAMFLKGARVSNVVNWVSLLWMGYWFSGIFPHTTANPSRLLGSGLILAILVYIACQAIAFRGWRFPLEGGLPVVANAYRLALERQRDFASGVWYWSRSAILVAGPLLSAYRAWLLKPSLVREIILRANLAAGVIIVVSLLLTWPKIWLSPWRKYQRTLDQLDALEGDGR
jgi:hypothetical protein